MVVIHLGYQKLFLKTKTHNCRIKIEVFYFFFGNNEKHLTYLDLVNMKNYTVYHKVSFL